MTRLDYWLDAEDFITAVHSDWDRFAIENGGAKVIAQHVVGAPLWDFIAGFEAQRYLGAVFFAVRHWGLPLTLPSRCDTRDGAFAYDMTVSPRRDSGLLVSHLPVNLATSVAISAQLPDAMRCAVCESPLPDQGAANAQTRGRVCRSCKATASRGIADLRDAHDRLTLLRQTG